MIILLSDDLMDASKTIASARALGANVVSFKTLSAAIDRLNQNDVACCIVDLQFPGLDVGQFVTALGALKKRTKIIAYGSHVDALRLKQAREAGCDLVLPRSAYFERMPSEIAYWAGQSPSNKLTERIDD